MRDVAEAPPCDVCDTKLVPAGMIANADFSTPIDCLRSSPPPHAWPECIGRRSTDG